jgi:hypothetical protein
MARRAGEISLKKWIAEEDSRGQGWLIIPVGGGSGIGRVAHESDAAHIVDTHNAWLESEAARRLDSLPSASTRLDEKGA